MARCGFLTGTLPFVCKKISSLRTNGTKDFIKNSTGCTLMSSKRTNLMTLSKVEEFSNSPGITPKYENNGVVYQKCVVVNTDVERKMNHLATRT